MSERFNPTDAELVEWLAERAFQLRMEHSPDAATVARSQWMADQLERCAKALKSHMVHSSWVPVKEWTPTEGELVLLKLRFEYRNAPALIHYDVARWTPRGGGDWDRARVGEVMAVAKLYEDTNGYGTN
jgi:hypothetical protein